MYRYKKDIAADFNVRQSRLTLSDEARAGLSGVTGPSKDLSEAIERTLEADQCIKLLKFGKEHGAFLLGSISLLGGVIVAALTTQRSFDELKARLEAAELRAQKDVVAAELRAQRDVVAAELRAQRDVEQAIRETSDRFLQLGFTEEYERYQKRLGLRKGDTE